jgi:hypothetical protein
MCPLSQSPRSLIPIALFLSLAPAALGESGERSVALGNWLEVTSPNLRLITDLEAGRAVDLVRLLEALRGSMTEEILGRATSRQLPTTVVAFAEETSYSPFRVVGREGQFYSTAFENLVVLNGGAPSRPLGMAAAHEYTHALLSELEIRLPLWLHEGLAEYYSTFDLSAGVVAIGRSVPGHRARLRNHAFLPLAELAAVDGRSAGYHGEDGARFYAQSWLMVHYLLSDAGCQLRLADLVRAYRNPADPAGAYSGVMPDEDLDRELRRYLSRDSVPVMLFPADGAEHLEVGHRSLPESEVAYQLGVVALEQARWDPERTRFARELLEAAVALDPTRGDALAAVASLEALEGRPAAAAEGFERAVFLDALEGRSYAYYAELLVETSKRGANGEVALRRAREMLERALEMEPQHRRIALRLQEFGAGSSSGL